jgi:hypothetical protein
MEYIVIILVIVFFIGSVSFSIPSKRSKQIAQLRLDAIKLGFKISSLAYSNISFKSDDKSLGKLSNKKFIKYKRSSFY